MYVSSRRSAENMRLTLEAHPDMYCGWSKKLKMHHPDSWQVFYSSSHRLRALSSGGSVTSPPPSPAMPKYKLAEYRYGREEMLALYIKDNKVSMNPSLFLLELGLGITEEEYLSSVFYSS